jgi:hypothetical protein
MSPHFLFVSCRAKTVPWRSHRTQAAKERGSKPLSRMALRVSRPLAEAHYGSWSKDGRMIVALNDVRRRRQPATSSSKGCRAEEICSIRSRKRGRILGRYRIKSIYLAKRVVTPPVSCQVPGVALHGTRRVRGGSTMRFTPTSSLSGSIPGFLALFHPGREGGHPNSPRPKILKPKFEVHRPPDPKPDPKTPTRANCAMNRTQLTLLLHLSLGAVTQD